MITTEDDVSLSFCLVRNRRKNAAVQKNGKKQRPQAIGGREGGAEEAAVEEAAAFQRG